MMASGGSRESEGAVIRGLSALAKIQNPDGSWGTDDKPAMTGLALLAFVGHGETADSLDFGPPIRRAIDWVLETGTKNDGTWSPPAEFVPIPQPIPHGILTMALAEYYALTKEERLAPLVEKAVGLILATQLPKDGWSFDHRFVPHGFIPVTVWQVQALLAARVNGLDVKDVDAALTRVPDVLERLSTFRNPINVSMNPRYCDIGAATFSISLQQRDYEVMARRLDHNQNPGDTVRDGLKYLFDNLKNQCPVDYKNSGTSLYGWYCNTGAFFLAGGNRWDSWNRLLQPELIKNQSSDGTWPPLAPARDGATIFTMPTSGRADIFNSSNLLEWATVPDLQSDMAISGSIYRTSLCVLMLEVYYRIPR